MPVKSDHQCQRIVLASVGHRLPDNLPVAQVQAIEDAKAGLALPARPTAQEAGALSGPPSIDGVASADAVASYCEKGDRARRQSSDWASARLVA
jgi:hypothetical protein